LGDAPKLLTYDIPQILGAPEKSVFERIERLLDWAVTKQRRLGKRVQMSDPSAIAATYSVAGTDVKALAQYLLEERLIEGDVNGLAQVTPMGFIKRGTTSTGTSANAFIAMWFDPAVAVAREHIGNAIRDAQYLPIIVDNVDHINKIDDEIISQIRKARFIVADLSGHRGGVYFEAGFAMGLGIPVFWTCNGDHFPNVHFDVRQYNTIVWKEEGELRTRLAKRIEAVVGLGPVARTLA
jgi:hypothetical protein